MFRAVLRCVGLGVLAAPVWMASCGGSHEPLPDDWSTSEGSDPDAGAQQDDSTDASFDFARVEQSACAKSARDTAHDADTGVDGAAPLPDTLRGVGTLVGTAIAGYRLADPQYAETAAREFNYVTPENEMKWDAIEPSPDSFSFPPADAVVRFAEQNDMLVKGHTLVWHSQLPPWVEDLSGEDEVRSVMLRHISRVIGHYREEFPGRVVAWDVVNEALESNSGNVSYRNSVFYRELGKDFIAEAFRAAREADSGALLFYNDFAIERIGGKSDATYEMLRELVENGVPIDGIGFQMHTGALDIGPTRDEFQENLERFVELGLRVNISEMDVTLCYGFADLTDALEAQRVRYNSMFGTCLQNPRCDSVSLWGVTDRYSWLNSYSPCDDSSRTPMPLAFDADYAKKPAWWGILDALTGCYYWED